MLDFAVALDARAELPAEHRVAIVTGSYDQTIDGVALTLNRLAAHLIRRGHEVLVLCPGARGRGVAVRHAGDLVRVPSVALPVWSEYRLTWGLGRAAQGALRNFSPTVMHIAVPDAMGAAAQRWAASRGIPSVCSHHTRWASYLDYYPLLPSAVFSNLAWWHLSRFHGRCAVTLPPSLAVKRELEAHGVPRVVVWPRGVDTSLFSPRRRRPALEAAAGAACVERSPACRGAGQPVRGAGDSSAAGAPNTTARRCAATPRSADDAPVVLFVARLRWEKGLREFAQVVRRVEAARKAAGEPVPRVLAVGDGPARAGFQALLPDARFTGTLTGEALAAVYASADVFLYPSTTEGWGGTCLEAQASGLPVVATNSSGITDVVAHGESGFLAPPGDVAAMAAAVLSLLQNATLRRSMGRAAAAHASGFSWEASGDLVVREYDRVAQRRRRVLPTAL